jgi:outer membrane protein W
VLAHAQTERPWLIRARGLAILPNASDDLAGAKIDVDNGYTAEVDINYRFTGLLAAELILATAAHEVEIANVSAGSVHILPPPSCRSCTRSPAARSIPTSGPAAI